MKGIVHTLGELQQVNSLLIDGLLDGMDGEDSEVDDDDGLKGPIRIQESLH